MEKIGGINMSKKIAIIASNGDMFSAYKVLNIAVAGATTDAEVCIFFTFEGVNMIHNQKMNELELPTGKEHMVEGFKAAKVPSIPELVEMAQDLGVKFVICQMTLDIMGLTLDQFVDGVESGGAVTFLQFASDSDVTLTF